MPELPEVETIVRDLKSIEGCKVVFNKYYDDKVFKTPFYSLAGRIIERIERFGKYIIIKFDMSAMIIHLGMTGQLFLDSGEALIPTHCKFLIQLNNREQLRYIDIRKFGKIWHLKSYEECLSYVQSKLGPEIWDINAESFLLRTKQSKYKNRILKDLLLDQKYIAGIGNIYASEICWEAYLHPKNYIKDLTDKQIENLYYCIKRVLEKAIENNGTTFSDYRRGNGQKGDNQNFLKVYNKHGEECWRCKHDTYNTNHNLTFLIKKEKIKDRMTYYCENCQRLYREEE